MRNVLTAVALSLAFYGCEDDKDETALDGAITQPTDARVAPNIDAGPGGSIDGGGKIDRSNLADTGTAPFDYGNKALWACLPGNDPNECRNGVDLTATEVLADGGTQKVTHAANDAPTFDCFYIYPTVATSGGGNMTNFSNIAPVLDPLRAQAARFSRVCEVYAPLYRQVSLTASSDAGVQRQGDPTLAVGDVLNAFDTYLSKWNKGRNFVVLGHSQGTSMATVLLQQRIDNDPAVRAKLISAVLLGGAIRTPPNARVGGTFANIPTCAAPGETGCAITYVSYAREAPPVAGKALFGAESDAGVVACTEPATLANSSGNYRGSYFTKNVSNPAFAMPGYLPSNLDTPYMLYRNFFKGTCVNRDGYSYLEIAINKAEGDVRQDPPYRNLTLESTGWGMHLVDYNLELDDLIEAVRLQAATKK
jgi:pimeloyl-ACP methyl ester carboxylesterase